MQKKRILAKKNSFLHRKDYGLIYDDKKIEVIKYKTRNTTGLILITYLFFVLIENIVFGETILAGYAFWMSIPFWILVRKLIFKNELKKDFKRDSKYKEKIIKVIDLKQNTDQFTINDGIFSFNLDSKVLKLKGSFSDLM